MNISVLEMSDKPDKKKKGKNHQMKDTGETNQATPKSKNEINGSKKKTENDVSPVKLPLTPISVSTTSTVEDSATKLVPFISVIETPEQAMAAKDQEQEPLPRLTSLDRLFSYPVLKELYFVTRGIYISLVVRLMLKYLLIHVWIMVL